MKKASILIIDDENAARFGMKMALQKDGYVIYEAEDGLSGLEIIKKQAPDIVFLDINMPKMNGLHILEKIKELSESPLVIVVTAYGSERLAVEAMKKGAYDYAAKPFEIDELRMIVRNAVEKIALEQENIRLKKEIDRLEFAREIIGQSKLMKDVLDRIEKVAETDVTVLIQGESGTGKELAAREIHMRSRRKDMPLIVVNCAALPEPLIESELFGHEKGAFTGATGRRLGKFELADGGTIFLDEIGDMSQNTQAKVLRILQEQKFERLGGSETLQVNVRIISATHKDLAAEIEKGIFRKDLYYRLKVVDLYLPPLRHRKEDIPLLVSRFLQVFSKKYNKPINSISKEAIKRLVEYNWPGNIRQLRNAIEGAVVLANSEILQLNDLPEEIKEDKVQIDILQDFDYCLPFKEAKKIVVETFEREFIQKKLEEYSGNISRTAEALGMLRQNLQQKLRELNMK